MSGDFWDLVRREAQNAVVSMRQAKGTLLCTAYNPKSHAVKGILMPHEVETGWIPISVAHAGNGFGVLIGPKVGDAGKAADGFDGDVFDVEFDSGDPNTPVAKLKHFSSQNQPPEVQSGEILMKHENGNSTYFAQDGSITTTHKSGGMTMFDGDGNFTAKTANKSVTVNAGTGSVTYKAKSHSFEGDAHVNGNLVAKGITGTSILDTSTGKGV